MNLMSISRPATGFAYDGSIQAFMNLQTFLADQDIQINSISMNADQGSSMKYGINMSYFKTHAEGAQPEYYSIGILPNYTVVSRNDSTTLQSLSQEQLELNYTVTE